MPRIVVTDPQAILRPIAVAHDPTDVVGELIANEDILVPARNGIGIEGHVVAFDPTAVRVLRSGGRQAKVIGFRSAAVRTAAAGLAFALRAADVAAVLATVERLLTILRVIPGETDVLQGVVFVLLQFDLEEKIEVTVRQLHFLPIPEPRIAVVPLVGETGITVQLGEDFLARHVRLDALHDERRHGRRRWRR